MIKKMVIVSLIFIGAWAVVGFAQYTGSDIERKKAENLYPEPGPGELIIIDQLKQNNIQLQEQTRLLSDQNRILLDTLNQIKKQQVPQVSGKTEE